MLSNTGGDPAGIIVFIRDGGVVVASFCQAAESIVSKRCTTEYPVAVALRHFLVCHLVGGAIAAVEMRAVRESGADAAPGGIIAIGQRASGKVGFSDKLPGFIVFEAVAFTFGVDDFRQAGESIGWSCISYLNYNSTLRKNILNILNQ